MPHPKQQHRPLTEAQLAALIEWRDDHGPERWKAALRRAWVLASAPAPLHRLRNTHGPAWLGSFTLPPSA